ncbi:MAG: NAD(P)H-dependent oxidoreductase [Actinomycetota bacterium]|nr:NAD(P)H-dependent oxidoreductase [Actinomycetota bacterium]
MSTPSVILAISGSLRSQSYNTKLLAEAAAVAPVGTKLMTWGDLASMPAFSEDHESDAGPLVHAMRAAIAEADAMLIATPEYNGSLPGQLENALDWASRPFPDNVLRDKPVAVIGASPSPGGTARAQADARKVLTAIGAQVLQAELLVPHAYRQFDSTGRLVDQYLRHQLIRLVAELGAARKPINETAA